MMPASTLLRAALEEIEREVDERKTSGNGESWERLDTLASEIRTKIGASAAPALACYHQFKAGPVDGYTTTRLADRVTLSFGYGSSLLSVLTLTAVEARAMANALYEAAEASETMLPVSAATVAA